jgi:methionine biosynthesis protein MetW
VRDSALKRTLVGAYFNACELRQALAGMVRRPVYGDLVDGYDEYWRHRTAAGLQPRFEIIGSAIARGASVLDIGCGDGVMLEHFQSTRGVKAIGIDVSAEAVRRACARGINARVQTLGELRGSGEAFDHVVMSEVVEHVADAERFVADAWAVTRRSLWVTFPNIAYFPHRLRLLSGKFPVQWVVFPGEHLRFWSIPDFTAWLSSLSLPAPRIVASNGFTVLGLHRAWPNLFANQIVVRCDR